MTKRKRTFYTCDLCGREHEGEEVSKWLIVNGIEQCEYKLGKDVPNGWSDLGHGKHVCTVCACELRKKEDE